MPSILKNCVVAIAGDLDDNEWRKEKVKQWVKYQGGKFSDTVDETVTHLLCTEENYKRKISPVRAALKNKVTNIVFRDWLEDSINQRSCLKTSEYQLDAKERKENAKKRKLEQAQKYSSNAERYVDERFWRAYSDTTYFKYQILLTRTDEEAGGVPEKHVLTLWESIAWPHNYICTTEYTKSKKKLRGRFPESPVHLGMALRKFKAYFREKTHIEWDDRIDKAGTLGPKWFQYQPPTGGKPVGLLNGRRASTPGKGVQHSNDNLPQKAKAIEADRKRTREKHLVNHAADTPDDVERPVKRPRYEEVETVHAHVEIKCVSTEHVRATSIASSSEENNQSDQDHKGQQPSERINDTASEDKSQLDYGNVTSNSISQSNGEYKPEHNSLHDNGASRNPFDGYRDALPHYPEADDEEPESHSEAEYRTPCCTPQCTRTTYPVVVDDYFTYNNDDDEGDNDPDHVPRDRETHRPLSPAQDGWDEMNSDVGNARESEA